MDNDSGAAGTVESVSGTVETLAVIGTQAASPLEVADSNTQFFLPQQGIRQSTSYFANGSPVHRYSAGYLVAPIVKADGSIQVVTVIENGNSPTEYGTRVTLPNDAAITIDVDGSFSAVDLLGDLILAAPTNST